MLFNEDVTHGISPGGEAVEVSAKAVYRALAVGFAPLSQG